MSTSPTAALLLESPRRLSVDEYHRMIETGILDEEERLELLEGVIVSIWPWSARVRAPGAGTRGGRSSSSRLRAARFGRTAS